VPKIKKVNFYLKNETHKAVIFSGASGAGKSTIVKYLLENNEGIDFSISACTRPKRPHEVYGRDYYFLSVQEFKNKIVQTAFLEWEEVYEGNYYGTLKDELTRIWTAGKTAIFDVDVHGGLRLKNYFRERALAIYVKVPSLEILAERLTKRGTETEETIIRRMSKVAYEDSLAAQFDRVLVNEHLQSSLANAQALLTQFLTT
jgi:guanylate kinase